MKEDEEAKQGFIIKDKRRFDDHGLERQGESEDAHVDAGQSAGSQKTEKAGTNAASGEEPEISFSSFLVSLATQALMQIGDIKTPDGVNIPIDLEAAKRTIDLLEMLQKKTKGNLEQEEAALIEEVLHTLRMSYVRAK